MAPVREGESLEVDANGLSGRVTSVPWGRRAGHVVVIARGGAGPIIVLVEGSSATIEEDCNMGREARDTLIFDNALVVDSAPLTDALGRNPIHLYGAMLRAAAKVVAGDAATTAASIVHQTHGAIGFTYEHSLHFSTRRLWSWRGEFGGEAYWAEILGRSVARRGADALWSDLTARQAGL